MARGQLNRYEKKRWEDQAGSFINLDDILYWINDNL